MIHYEMIQKIKNFLFKVKSKIFREFYLFFRLRPASYPYISGDGFRKMSNHIYDDLKTFNPDDVKENDIVFVQLHSIKEYFEKMHPFINAKYKLITHNGDDSVGEEESKLIDEKIIHWFAQNNIFAHSKITPIPIGIENKKWVMSGYVLYKLIKRLRTTSVIKKNRILFGFNVNTNLAERFPAQENLRKCLAADEIKQRINPPQYVELLNQYRFVASPPGNGTDCIRTWEALLLGTIPICKSSVLINYFQRLGAPILTIENWSEIAEIDEAKLRELYDKNKSKLNNEYLLMDSWIKLIKTTNDQS